MSTISLQFWGHDFASFSDGLPLIGTAGDTPTPEQQGNAPSNAGDGFPIIKTTE